MIQLVKRKKLDVNKYDECIENSMQSNVYGYSWYLDIVCDNWSVLVLNDYEAVMPIPWRRKFFIKYVYPPFWLIQLGIYSEVLEDENEFLIELFSEYKYVNSRVNAKNAFSMFEAYREEKQLQFLQLTNSYQDTFSNYKKDRRKDLKRAKNNNLSVVWNDIPENLIELYIANVGKRIRKIKEDDYTVLLKIMKLCIVKGKGEVLSVFNEEKKIVASGFFLKHKGRVTILVSSTDLKNRKNGANTFLIDTAIQKYHSEYSIFDFGGSSMKNIAAFFKSFNASTEFYDLLKYNNLPRLLRFFKR